MDMPGSLNVPFVIVIVVASIGARHRNLDLCGDSLIGGGFLRWLCQGSLRKYQIFVDQTRWPFRETSIECLQRKKR